ncbi:MAG: zinc ribbon domain-containing protein [Desulfovibrio sp.]|jgi:putative FmdB family regulatory protein|nr:zinc ribbon domain-containing protein [Desulfovibrio sp.]MBI4958084.1 zinc ribbon domain-containing protein [Desulfovibrio sp.]
MPIYEYRCEKCGCDFEELVFGDATPPCPKCSSENTKKLMSACRHSAGHNPGGYQGSTVPASSGGGGCAGCSGGSCATCK